MAVFGLLIGAVGPVTPLGARAGVSANGALRSSPASGGSRVSPSRDALRARPALRRGVPPGARYHFRRTISAHGVQRAARVDPAVSRQTAGTHARSLVAATAGGPRVNTVAPSAPSRLSAFEGTSQNLALASLGSDQATAPPDPNLAVGPNDVVEATNSALFFFTRSGIREAVLDINALVAKPSSSWAVTDPRVVYDPADDRFYLSVEAFDASGGSCGSEIFLLRTDSGDPTGGWDGFVLFNAATLNSPFVPFADQPGLGFTSNVVAVTWNYYECNITNGVTGSFAGGQLDVIQKSDLLSASATPHTAAIFTGGPFGNQPAVSLGFTSVLYIVYNNSDPVEFGVTPSIGVDPFTGTPQQQNVVMLNEVDEPITATSTTGSPPSVVPAQQSGTAQRLQTDDDRLLNAVWQSGRLWTADTTDCTPSGDSTMRSCLNIVRIDVDSSGNVTGRSQVPFVGVTGAYLYYPSVSVDAAGNAYVVFDESSASAFESIAVAGVVGGAISGFTTLNTSGGYYDYGSCVAAGCRWGDYSGAAQDPTHPTDVWVVSEDSDNESTADCSFHECWSTYVGRYTYSLPSIAKLTPAAGPVGGGQTVTVAGSDFLTGTTATLGGTTVTPAGTTPDSFTFTTPAHAAGYVSAVATSSLGSSAATAGAGYIYVPVSSYFPLKPFRILDTRSGLCGVNSCPSLGPGGVLTLRTSGYTDPGTSESVPSNATAVVLNVTAVNDTSFSLLSLWPNGTGQPLAANLNFDAHVNTANLVTVVLGQNGASDTNREVEVFNALGTLDIVADVEGYFASAPASTPTGEFTPIPPLRVCDTRVGQPLNVCNQGHATDDVLGPGQSVKVNVSGVPAGVGGSPPSIPSNGNAGAAVLNLAAVSGTLPTYLSVFPTDSSGNCPYGGANPAPPTANINVNASTNQANRVVVPLGPDHTGGPTTDVCVYNSLGTINFVLDANGWFGSSSAPSQAKQFQPIGPSRICDTRAGQGTPCTANSLTAGAVLTVAVAGQGGVPGSGIVAVILNVTAVSGTQGTFLSVYQADVPRPNASDINVNAGQNLPNLVIVALSAAAPAGDVDAYNSLGTIDAVMDVAGWFQ